MESAHRKYVVRTFSFMAIYVALNAAAIRGVFNNVGSSLLWLLAVAVALPAAGQLWATLQLMREGDEFVSHLTAKRFIVAAGAAIALLSAWGFSESYAGAVHLPGWVIYPLFWVVFGISAPFIRTTRP